MGWGEFRCCVLTLKVKSLTRSMGVFRKVGAALGEKTGCLKTLRGVATEEGAIKPISTSEGLGAKAQIETHLP